MLYRNTPHLAVERFHAEFLRCLNSALAPGLYAVKGGVNLRICLGSIRCSEDLDIDVQTVAKATLQKSVDKILENRLPKLLAPLGFSIAQFSSPKQTDTVQRWKISLLVDVSPVATKVEFSRRGVDEGVETSLIHPQVALVHQIPPFAVPHYGQASAVKQKAAALAGRPLTQARDIFDLHFLFSQGGGKALSKLPLETLTQAAENCLNISWQDYQGQVVAYLPTEHQAAYGGKTFWENMQEMVFKELQQSAEKAKS